MPTGDELAASRQEAGLDHRTQRPAHQEPPRPRPEPAWPPGQAGGRGRQAPQRWGRPRSRAHRRLAALRRTVRPDNGPGPRRAQPRSPAGDSSFAVAVPRRSVRRCSSTSNRASARSRTCVAAEAAGQEAPPPTSAKAATIPATMTGRAGRTTGDMPTVCGIGNPA
jgi:hypothetical protein